MTKSTIKHRIIAFFMLVIFSVETFYPATLYALTSGPTTPEMSAFEPASTANMVDMFSGDFSYNIPLLDVGGYPVNLAYRAGSNPDEEASWVGFGWSLNPGAINRQLRGLPDDFKGDVLNQEDNKKPNITVGGNINVSLKIFGNRLPKIKIGRKKKNANGKMKIKIGILHNNYTGYKGMVGIGTSFNTSDDNSDAATKGLGPASSTDLSASLGLNVDNQSGINPYADYEVNFKVRSKKERVAEHDYYVALKEHQTLTAISACFFGGLLDLSKSKTKVDKLQQSLNHASHSGASFGASSSISFNGFQAPSLIQTPMKSKNFTATLDLGITLFGGTIAPGIEGTYSKQELKSKTNSAPAYGFMNGSTAKSNEDAVLDYNMEKESPYFKRLPNLGVTVFTPDIYNVTSNAGSMQFRPYLRGTGIFFQPHKHDPDVSVNLGLEPAFGNIFHIGIPLQINKTNSISGKWTSRNDYMNIGDFKITDPADVSNQAFYFKRVGEKNKQDNDYFNDIGNTSAVAVALSNGPSAWAFGNGKAKDELKVKGGGTISNNFSRHTRDKANNAISYLTASEASMYALEKQIPNYRENTLPTAPNAIKNYVARNSGYRQSHHISQYAITQDDGQRMIYGTPVYNTTQEEVSFAVPFNQNALQTGIYQYNGTENSSSNSSGKDNYYHKSITPAYTTGFLLTGILSPDYVDAKSDGITDDDLGTAVKFNYSELSDASGNAKLYKWRTPYTNVNSNVNVANYNEGYKSIKDDDKANFTWGQKELWYLNSIESKTMVAQFITEDRDDGVGVVDANGGKDGNIRLKRLKEIKLYSKADLYANGTNAVPVKVVHLEYYPDYPIVNLLPNNINGKGKLTLKRVWFSYGNNTSGQYHSYNFKYKIPPNQDFQDNQSDRWGNYKPKSTNPYSLDNLEFPYATQNKINADDFASYWQLNEIELPSGAIINVDYESDDYAYVQDRRSMQMCFMNGIGGVNATSGFASSDKVYVNLPVSVSNNTELGKRYFDGLKSLAYRAYIDMNGNGNWEYVSGYADIASYQLAAGSNNIAEVTVGKINGKYNPIAKASWQKLKLDLPRFAFPEYDNLDSENSGFISAIRALGAAFSRFKDLVESFDKRAKRKGFGDKVNLQKSWVRLCSPNYTKLGGGHRVREIRITDQWSTMSGVATAENGSYGQRYEYKTDITGPGGAPIPISSGVASYEPGMGADENPFHEPINYSDKQLFGLPKYFYLERPMGESYFPGASVGYSKVTVKNLGSDGSVGENGMSVNEYYTAKDFPTKVDELPIERRQPKLNFLPRLFGAKVTSAVTVSQGYMVENNDMHGKQKVESTYGKNGEVITSNKYYYKVDNPAAEKLDLNNKISVVNPSGSIEHNMTVGMDIDMFTEMNESMMENMGIAIDPSFGVALYGIIPKFSFKLPLPKPNYEKRLYRGSTTIKLVNRYAILDKIVKTVNGSTSTTQNMLWDSETGEVVLSKTNNEYNEDNFTFNYPAHWAYDRMGSAFKNEGVYLTGFSSTSTGQVTTYNNIIVPGDELIDINSSNKYWVINTNGANRVIDKDGALKQISSADIKIMRSGRRNLNGASVGSIISMSNPISGNTISISYAKRILQAKAVNYEEDWPMPVDLVASTGHYLPQDCAGPKVKSSTKKIVEPSDTLIAIVKNGKTNYQLKRTENKEQSPDNLSTSCLCSCLKGLFDYLITTNRLFTLQSQNITVGQLVNQANAAGFPVGSCSILDNNMNKPFYAITTNPYATIYTARIGDCVVSIRSTNNNPVRFDSLRSQTCGTSSVVNYSAATPPVYSATYLTTCTKTILYGQVNFPNPDQRIVYALDNQSFAEALSQFNIPGISTIPQNATILSADMYMYALPGGYFPPTFPNAHTTLPNQRIQIDRVMGPRTCTGFYNGGQDHWSSIAITSPNQNVIVNCSYLIQDIVSLQANYGFWLLSSASGNIGGLHSTFASENYPDASKRPKLVVTYSLPAPTTTIATLTIDDCVSQYCDKPVFNPYVKGIRGNWRTKKEILYDTKRVNNNGYAGNASGTRLRNSGYFASFNPYWSNVGATWQQNTTDNKWQWANETKKFNLKGQEIENVDALGRFGSAQYGYLQSVPVAVSGNAMHREIGYDGFEDYNFNLGLPNPQITDSCLIQDHFSFRSLLGNGVSLDNSKSHTGKYSLKLTGTAVLEKPLLQNEPTAIYSTASNAFKITDGYLKNGLTPVPSKKYVLSGWINDGQPKSPLINGFTLKISGTSYDVNDNANNPSVYSKVNIVEGWKRFEVVFTMPATGTFKLEVGGSLYIDDIRLHPYDAQLKSFAYDASSMRLMADLDENNFATFYEYDDEGTLIRVKKETEKGISTIKETRSSLRKKP